MKITNIVESGSDDNRVKVVLEDCSLSLVNALRRTIIDDVQTYAFDRDLIVCEKNTSLIDDDMFADILEQIPITPLFDSTDSFDESSFGSFKCQGENGKIVIMTAQKHIEIENFEIEYDCEMNQFFDSTMMIEGILGVQKGCGKVHSKFCPVSLITFHSNDETIPDDNCMNWTLVYDAISKHNKKNILFEAIDILKNKLSDFRDTLQKKKVHSD